MIIASSTALSGRGTPPTKTVFRGSSGMEASSTKSASLSRQGRICTGLSLIVGELTQREAEGVENVPGTAEMRNLSEGSRICFLPCAANPQQADQSGGNWL
ncbi:hypothetical protein ALC56_10888 [Trachymyrmex septentrionalis]|uniref:Uncharacterized protein n=1 Tax=Trachymyrmex septentrionalis TaxID=34720 RepID=A0A195F2W8_9HYME|nr:hypothetical protein ALC56_10888 [Trachymyrmex septentrionalis]